MWITFSGPVHVTQKRCNRACPLLELVPLRIYPHSPTSGVQGTLDSNVIHFPFITIL